MSASVRRRPYWRERGVTRDRRQPGREPFRGRPVAAAGQVDGEVVGAPAEAGEALQRGARQEDDRERAALGDEVVGVGGREQVLGAARQPPHPYREGAAGDSQPQAVAGAMPTRSA